jgi:hypothetical protein
VQVQIDDTPPVIGYSYINNIYISLKYLNITCSDHCTDSYEYSIVDQAQQCSQPYAYTQVYGQAIEIDTSSKVCIKAYDTLGRSSIRELNVDIMNINIGDIIISGPKYLEDKYVIATSSVFNLSVSTLIDVTCRYVKAANLPNLQSMLESQDYTGIYAASQTAIFNTTGGTTHTVNSIKINSPINNHEEWIIICRAANINPNTNPYISKMTLLSWDNTSPVTNISIIPDTIYDYSDRKTLFRIYTDDKSFCSIKQDTMEINSAELGNPHEYSSYDTVHNHTQYYTNPENENINTLLRYVYNISCENTAGLLNITTKEVIFDLKNAIDINFTSPLLYLDGHDMTISAITDVIAECDLAISNGMTSTDYGSMDGRGTKEHSKIITLDRGEYTATIRCSAPGYAAITGTESYDLAIDVESPTVVLTGPDSYIGPNTTCSLDGFTVNVYMDDDTGIQSYEYLISGNGIASNYHVGSSGNLNFINVIPGLNNGISLRDGEMYTIYVGAKDYANRTGESSIQITTYSSETGIACDNRGPNLGIRTSYLRNNTFAVVNVSCNDSRILSEASSSSGCSNYFRYSFMEDQENCAGADYTSIGEYGKKLIFFISSGTLCVSGNDLAGNSNNNEARISLSPMYCGNDRTEVPPSSAYFGMDTSFNNWDWGLYNSLAYEECDGTIPVGNTESCLTRGFTGGSISCNSDCTINTNECSQGMNVYIVSPLPFGVGNTLPYDLTVNSEFDASCRYGLLLNSQDIVSSYNNGQMSDMISVGQVGDGTYDHTRTIYSAIPSINGDNYLLRYAICHMNNIQGYSGSVENEYGIVEVREGYDATVPQILRIMTDKPNDIINDWNDRKITVFVETNEPTICTISDSVNYLNEYVMDGNANDYNSYSTVHMTPIDYTNALTTGPADHVIAYTITCRNKAGLQIIQGKNITYDLDEQITIISIAPVDNYTSGYTVTYSIMTNILSTCYITNGSSPYILMGDSNEQSLYHEEEIYIGEGWNTIGIRCVDETSNAITGTVTYEIYGAVNEPIDMDITTSETMCGLSTINATLHATPTSLNIIRYQYSVNDVNTGTTICSGVSSNGQISCSHDSINEGQYIIEAWAIDEVGHTSETAYAFITVVGLDSITCDITVPTINMLKLNIPFLDIAAYNITCTDSESGCSLTFDYSIIDILESCTNAGYELSKSYIDSSLNIANSGTICIRGRDNNNNYGYKNATITLIDNNYINITPVEPIFVDPNIIVTTDPITDIVISTNNSVDAECRYSFTPAGDDLAAAFENFIPFNITGGSNHTIFDLNTQGIYSQFIQMICYSPQLSDNPYSSTTFQVIYVEAAPSIEAYANPYIINDWNNRHTTLSIITDMNTVCRIDSQDGQHDGIMLGEVTDATTYERIHYTDLSYDINTATPRTYYYYITCMNLAGQSNTAMVGIEYSLTSTLEINILSPTTYTSSSIEVVASTNIVGECSLTINEEYRGKMYADVTGRNHMMSVDGLSNGTYNVGIDCSAPTINTRASTDYNIFVNIITLRKVCGDGIVQQPNDDRTVEECDLNALNSKSCTEGFVGYNFIGGELNCYSDCTFDVRNCDNGNGWCGNDEVEGPNSNGFMEQCDGRVPSGLSCDDFGFDRGKLSCDDCTINTSGCMVEGQVLGQTVWPICNNHQMESGEQCEIGGTYDIKCSYFGYDSGTLSCNNLCKFDFNLCKMENYDPGSIGSSNCGNNIKNTYEECDGTSGLEDTSCEQQGNFTGGTLGCNADDCTFDFSECTYIDECANGMKDIAEADVDCGGPCAGCSIGYTCFGDNDCESQNCGNESKCIVNPCNNNILDEGSETDIDCGFDCAPCTLDKKCAINDDCESDYCNSDTYVCSSDPCSNGIQDEGEIDIDCGGNCVLCGVGQSCISDADCGTYSCINSICEETIVEPEVEQNPVKLPLLIFGLILIVTSGGYIVYKIFIEEKPKHSGFGGPPGGFGGVGITAVQKPSLTPEQREGMERRRREIIEKRRKERHDERQSVLQKLGDIFTDEGEKDHTEKTTEDDIEKLSEKKISKIEKDESLKLKTDEEGYVEVSQLMNADIDKKKTFDELKKIGGRRSNIPDKAENTVKKTHKKFKKTFKKIQKEKASPDLISKKGLHNDINTKIAIDAPTMPEEPEEDISSSLTDISNSDKLNATDALKIFGKIDKNTIMSEAFKDTLSELISNGKMTKEDVFHILFEYMDKGLLTKSDVAKISSELKII